MNKKMLWFTESWSYDTDKEIVPYLMKNSDYEIKWVVMKENLHKYIEDNFSLESVAPKYVEFFNEVMR